MKNKTDNWERKFDLLYTFRFVDGKENASMIGKAKDVKQFISTIEKQAYQRGLEQHSKELVKIDDEIIDAVLELSKKYWLDREIGSKPPLVVNKTQYKNFVKFELSQT